MEDALSAAFAESGYAKWAGVARIVARRGSLGIWVSYTCSSWDGSAAVRIGVVWPEASVIRSWLGNNSERAADEAPVFVRTLAQFDAALHFSPGTYGGHTPCASHIVSVIEAARPKLIHLLDPLGLITELRALTLHPAVPSEYALRALPI